MNHRAFENGTLGENEFFNFDDLVCGYDPAPSHADDTDFENSFKANEYQLNAMGYSAQGLIKLALTAHEKSSRWVTPPRDFSPPAKDRSSLQKCFSISIRSLKDWFAYTDNPTDTTEAELRQLQLQSGKAPAEYTPTRAGTPIPRRRSEKGMHPAAEMGRNSPPENEPARAVSAIARRWLQKPISHIQRYVT
ncbi:hypothetical protein CEK25_007565 [Fusarium fujikuroi]|nr:hypothetical protein CEK25_007565 [Fusarium fujikuroi]